MNIVQANNERRMRLRKAATDNYSVAGAATAREHIQFNTHHLLYQYRDKHGNMHAYDPGVMEMNESQFALWLNRLKDARYALKILPGQDNAS